MSKTRIRTTDAPSALTGWGSGLLRENPACLTLWHSPDSPSVPHVSQLPPGTDPMIYSS